MSYSARAAIALAVLSIATPTWAADSTTVETKTEKAAEKPAEKADDKAGFTAPKADLTLATAGTYQLDPAHTNVFFRVAHLGFSGYMGRFNKVEGKVNLEPKELAKTTLEVSIDSTSIDVNNDKLATELRDKEMFDSTTYPAITFKSTKFEQKDATRIAVTGDLTVRGVTKPVTLEATLNGVGNNPMSQKPTMGFSATTMIKRSDFGLAKWLPMVGDQVQIIIETELYAN